MSNVSFSKEMGANKGGTDEWYTPEDAVLPLIPYIKPGSKILCPFDKSESNYVKVLSRDFEVINSHIDDGVDFFTLEKPNVDYIVSNPPYSKRTDIIKQLYQWNIPFAMMFNSNGIFDNKIRFDHVKNRGGELLFLYPRVTYIDTLGKKICSSIYECLLVLQNAPGETNI